MSMKLKLKKLKRLRKISSISILFKHLRFFKGNLHINKNEFKQVLITFSVLILINFIHLYIRTTGSHFFKKSCCSYNIIFKIFSNLFYFVPLDVVIKTK